MKNYKQLLMDFYLALLSYDNHDRFKRAILLELSYELNENPDTVRRIFERMVEEDKG